MSCTKSLTIGPALGDNAMDNAVYDAFDDLIIGIRGNRVFKCNATTGAVVSQADIGTFGRNGCLAYDSGTKKVFVAVWNTAHYEMQVTVGIGNPTLAVSTRNLYRINPSTLAVELTADITTSFNLVDFDGNGNAGALLEAGICAMDAGAGGYIYCRYFTCFETGGVGGGTLRFSGANIATFNAGGDGATGGNPNVIYSKVGGGNHDCALYIDQQGGPEWWVSDYTDGSLTNTYNIATTRTPLILGFAPTQQHVFITDVAQLIYVYTSVGVAVTTIDTLRSAFNGLAVRYNSVDGLVYVPGGCDNTVCVIDPATNLFTIKTGFDAPVDVVFTTTKKFAVQAGSVPLKEIT